MEKKKDDKDRDDERDDDDRENGKHKKRPDFGCPPVAEGACIPVSPGSKPK